MKKIAIDWVQFRADLQKASDEAVKADLQKASDEAVKADLQKASDEAVKAADNQTKREMAVIVKELEDLRIEFIDRRKQ